MPDAGTMRRHIDRGGVLKDHCEDNADCALFVIEQRTVRAAAEIRAARCDCDAGINAGAALANFDLAIEPCSITA
jgi:hypothetical protein